MQRCHLFGHRWNEYTVRHHDHQTGAVVAVESFVECDRCRTRQLTAERAPIVAFGETRLGCAHR